MVVIRGMIRLVRDVPVTFTCENSLLPYIYPPRDHVTHATWKIRGQLVGIEKSIASLIPEQRLQQGGIEAGELFI